MLRRLLAPALLAACSAGLLLVAGDPTAPSDPAAGSVVTAASWAAWAVVSWLGLGVLLVGAATLHGAVGRTAEVAARVLVPRFLIRTAQVALGVAVASAPAVAPASAEHRGWPDLDRATTAPTRPAAAVLVAPGDCLWRIAARDLTRNGDPPTDSAVAGAWPRWYAANREVIGPDPDLIRPGQRLVPPERRPR